MAGLVNGGMVNSGHALVNGGAIRATAAAFPTLPQASDIKLLLYGDNFVGADGDPMATWPDTSGVNNTPTAAGAARPIYKTNIINGHAVSRYDGSANFMDLADAANLQGVPISLLFVFKPTAVGFRWLMERANFPGWGVTNNPRVNFTRAVGQDFNTAATAVTLNNFHIAQFRHVGDFSLPSTNNYEIVVNNGTAVRGVQTLGSMTGAFRIGALTDGTEKFQGDIACIVGWTGNILSDANVPIAYTVIKNYYAL